MKIQTFIKRHLNRRLADDKTLVVFDPDGLYRSIVSRMASEKTVVVDGSESTILGRETAMTAWCRMGQSDDENIRLLVYIPIRKPVTEKERQLNPYQTFALGGGAFPAGDGESYQALCRQAAPDLAPKIDQLFSEGLPDFETVNNLLSGGANWPKLKTLLKAESAAEILAAVMSPTGKQQIALEEDGAWLDEFKRFLTAVLDCRLKTKSAKLSTVAAEIWRYVLFSEFTFDLPQSLPDALKDVPRAADRFAGLVYAVCDSLRQSEQHQQRYMELANLTAVDLKLEVHVAGVTDLGKRDTFAFEERFYLNTFVEAVIEGAFDKAVMICDQRNRSIWVRHIAERQQLWTLAGRALRLMTTAGDMKKQVADVETHTGSIFDFYCERFRLTDRLHRDFEQAVTDAYGELGVLEKIVVQARKQYLGVAEALQAKMMAAVKIEGWPVSDRIRQSDVFDRFVAPWLKDRQKVAYFLVDALRYELAVELENDLSDAFATEIKAVCAQLPTVTSVGMAALMPEADGSLTLVKEKNGFVPYVKGKKVVVPKDRHQYLQGYYGDRCHMRHLDELSPVSIVLKAAASRRR